MTTQSFPEFETITYDERDDGVAIVTLNRPERHNAFNSLMQREVFVSTMGTIYNIDNPTDAEGRVSLADRMRGDRDPATGLPTYTVLTALCVMVYYVLAMQCLSTVAVMRRETNGWRWPLFQIGYMTALAYGVTFLVYRAGLWLGIGG